MTTDDKFELTINKPAKDLTEADFDTAMKIEHNLGKQFMDMDSLAKDLMTKIKGVSSEMEYKLQLDINTKIYMVFMAVGILMILTMILTL